MTQDTFAADLEGFDQVYRRHVALVLAQDMPAVLADMAPGSVPAVFAGVETPQGVVESADVRDARLEGDRGVGEAVYATADGVIGLRSFWTHDGATWKADALENFVP